MTNANFRNSNIAELFGSTNIGTPPPPGQINWQSVAIHSAIVIVGVFATVIIIRQMQKSQMQNIIVHTQNLHDESISIVRDELADQRVLIFKLANAIDNNTSKVSEQKVKS